LIVAIVRSTYTQLDFFSDVSMLWKIEFIHARPPSIPAGWTAIYCPDHLLMPIRPQVEPADEGETVRIKARRTVPIAPKRMPHHFVSFDRSGWDSENGFTDAADSEQHHWCAGASETIRRRMH